MNKDNSHQKCSVTIYKVRLFFVRKLTLVGKVDQYLNDDIFGASISCQTVKFLFETKTVRWPKLVKPREVYFNTATKFSL